MTDIFKSASKIAMLLTVIGAFMLTAFSIEITEPLKTISLMIISFYFWGKTKSKEIE